MNEEKVIRNNKTNFLMQPGYAFDRTLKTLCYSSMYLDDIHKTREEIEEENNYTADQLKAIREKRRLEIELQQRKDIAVTSGLSYGKVILGMDISALIFITQAFIGIYSYLNAHYTLAFVSFAVAGGAAVSYEVNRIQRFKLRKARNEAYNRALKEGKLPEVSLSREKELEIKAKNELDQKLLLEAYKGRLMNEVFDKLGPTLQEKIEEQKYSEQGIQKTMSHQK